jgi:hypothetical protein
MVQDATTALDFLWQAYPSGPEDGQLQPVGIIGIRENNRTRPLRLVSGMQRLYYCLH